MKDDELLNLRNEVSRINIELILERSRCMEIKQKLKSALAIVLNYYLDFKIKRRKKIF